MQVELWALEFLVCIEEYVNEDAKDEEKEKKDTLPILSTNKCACPNVQVFKLYII